MWIEVTRHLSHSRDDVSLDFGSNFASSMSVCNGGCGIICCSFQFSCVSGVDFVAKESALAICNGWDARRGCPALVGSRVDCHAGETCVLQLTTDQLRIVIAVRGAC